MRQLKHITFCLKDVLAKVQPKNDGDKSHWSLTVVTVELRAIQDFTQANDLEFAVYWIPDALKQVPQGRRRVVKKKAQRLAAVKVR